MEKIKKTSLALTVFYLFSILYFATTAQAETQGVNKNCPEFVKEMQMRVKGLKKIHKGMYNSVHSSLPSDRFDRYNRHLNILAGNLDQQVKLMKKSLEALQQRGRICHDMAQGLSPHINTMHEIHEGILAAVFDSNTSNYKMLIEKLESQVKDISGELDKHSSHS